MTEKKTGNKKERSQVTTFPIPLALKKSKELEKRNNYNPYKGIKDKGF